MEQAKISLEIAQLDWENAKQRIKSANYSPFDYNLAAARQKTAKAAVPVAEAVLAQHKAALKQAEIELGYTAIRSPIKGVIIDRRVNVGQTVTGGLNSASLFLVADIEKLQVWVSVKEADIGQIHQGQHARITVDAYPGKVFEGEVKQIRLNATMTRNVVTYTVVVALSGPKKELLPYMTALIEFESKPEDAASRETPLSSRTVPAAIDRGMLLDERTSEARKQREREGQFRRLEPIGPVELKWTPPDPQAPPPTSPGR